jgi:hypothetical protein
LVSAALGLGCSPRKPTWTLPSSSSPARGNRSPRRLSRVRVWAAGEASGGETGDTREWFSKVRKGHIGGAPAPDGLPATRAPPFARGGAR